MIKPFSRLQLDNKCIFLFFLATGSADFPPAFPVKLAVKQSPGDLSPDQIQVKSKRNEGEEEGGEDEEAQIEEESTFSGWSDEDPNKVELPKVNLEYDLGIAMRYLQRLGERNESVWHHLNEMVSHVLKEQPEDCMRYFEELSRDLRMKRYVLETDHFDEQRDLPIRLAEAEHMLKFYRKIECYYEGDDPFLDDTAAEKDLIEKYGLLSEAGVGIPRTVLYNIYMSMRYLAKVEPVLKLRLWGIVLGTRRNYIVVEAKLTEEALKQRIEKIRDEEHPASEVDFRNAFPDDVEEETIDMEEAENRKFEKNEIENEQENENITNEIPPVVPVNIQRKFVYEFPPEPKATLPIEPHPPYEVTGEGTNRFVYYVTNDPGEPWIVLPDVKPEHIVCARKIQKFLTGILSSEVISFPTFPGNETELLRAQIARISASTHVSPAGFYLSGDEEEGAAAMVEEGDLFAEDPDYDPLPIKNLLDETMEFWVHHEKFILGHGTTLTWRRPREFDETDEEEAEGEGMDEAMELPPNSLRSLAEDVMDEPMVQPWTARQTAALMESESAVMVTSNIWPGALAVTRGRKTLNFYVGWGMKPRFVGYSPLQPGTIQKEYVIGPEIMEMTDPTVEMEELRWQMLHPPKLSFDYEMGEEGDEEESRESDET